MKKILFLLVFSFSAFATECLPVPSDKELLKCAPTKENVCECAHKICGEYFGFDKAYFESNIKSNPYCLKQYQNAKVAAVVYCSQVNSTMMDKNFDAVFAKLGSKVDTMNDDQISHEYDKELKSTLEKNCK